MKLKLAITVKLLIEIINGILSPMMILVVASFINNMRFYSLALIAIYYAYSQIIPIVIRLIDKSLDNSLREKLRPQLITKQSRISYTLLEDSDTLDLIARVCGKAESQMISILNSGIGLIRLTIQVFGTLSILANHVWWMIPLFIASALPIAIIAHKGGKAIYASDVITTKLTRRHYYLSSILVGRDTAAERTLFGYAEYVNRKFSAAHLKRSNMVTKEIAVEEIAVNTCGLILNVLVIVAVTALLQSTISHGLFVSLVGAMIGLARIITSTVSKLVSDTTGYIEYLRDYTRFHNLAEVDDSKQAVKIDNFTSLEIRNLRFRYTTDSDYVLNGINLVMEHGKSYSLIGKNGSGKSTLTKILLGLYRDFEGEILINGIDIAMYSTTDLHKLFSIVYQDYAKYSISLSDNITFGNPNGDLDSAIQLAELHNMDLNMHLGKVYDDGADISGGEWQKVAIARALYADTAFMILDEPTANLSPMNESKLYRKFAEITKSKTSLLISHRLGSTKLSDVLFVLDNGVINECGTHDELMKANGIYSEMFTIQRSWYDEN